jgi:hypothetical protein
MDSLLKWEKKRKKLQLFFQTEAFFFHLFVVAGKQRYIQFGNGKAHIIGISLAEEIYHRFNSTPGRRMCPTIYFA